MRAPILAAAALAALAVAAGAAPSGRASAQPVDTLAAPGGPPLGPPVVLADSSRERTPRGAVTRALLVPGLGQVYNRQPVKAPVAAALVAGGVAFAVDRQRRYRRIQLATRYAGCNPDDPNAIPDRELCAEALAENEDEWIAEGSKQFAALGAINGPRNRARGQRDIGVLVAVVAYAFQAFDAYVFAELAGFDVSEDVAVTLEPGPGPPALGLRVRL